MPGSSSGPRPRNAVLNRHGVNLVSYNRPGYGRSSRRPNRTVADAADDVEFLANYLGFGPYTVLGRSGGGPHALACAARRPDRVLRAAVLVSFAPADATDLDWYRNMAGSNVDAYRDASSDQRRLTETLRVRANRVKQNPAHLLDLLRTEATAADARIIDDVYLRELLLRTYRDAVTDGPYGWIDDVLALRRDWGFRPQDIRVPVRLWHGEDDQFAPPSHTQWLAAHIPGAKVEVQPGAAHFGALSVVPRLLEWLAAAQPPADATLTH
jgi:pimeloyl-ACP methyl ester carboxylesterase